MVLDLDPITNKVKIDNRILHFSPYTVYYMLLKHSGEMIIPSTFIFLKDTEKILTFLWEFFFLTKLLRPIALKLSQCEVSNDLSRVIGNIKSCEQLDQILVLFVQISFEYSLQIISKLCCITALPGYATKDFLHHNYIISLYLS